MLALLRHAAAGRLGGAGALVAGDGRDPAEHPALHRRRHRLHLRPGLQAGGAWPKITLHSLTRSIDYGSGDDARRGRAEPRRAARRRRLSALRAAAQRPVRERRDRLEPGRHRRRRRARASSPTACTSSGSRRTACSRRRCAAAPARPPARAAAAAVAFDWPGRFTATAFIAADGLVRAGRVDLRRPGARRHAVVTTYDDYRDVGGIQFPMRVRQTIGGYPVLDLAVTEVQVNPSLALRGARRGAQRGRARDLGEGGRRRLVRRRRLAQQRR